MWLYSTGIPTVCCICLSEYTLADPVKCKGVIVACAHKVVKVCGNSGCNHDTSSKVPRQHSCGEDTTYISTIPGALPSNVTGLKQQGVLILANYLFIEIS